MFRSITKKILFTLCACSIAMAKTDSSEPEMFLCVDSMIHLQKNTGSTPVKLVYGYINGKKTECMTEYEFREKYSKKVFEQTQASQPDSQKLLEQRYRKHKTTDMSPIEAASKGIKDLAELDFHSSDLAGLNLAGADLHNANLNWADLRNCDLRNANLQGAKLEAAYLKNADLRGANLTNADIRGAFFHLANMTGVIGLEMGNLSMVQTLYKTVLDSELLIELQEKMPSKFRDPGWNWRTSDSSSTISNAPEEKKADRKRFH